MSNAAAEIQIPFLRRIPFSFPSFLHGLGGGVIVLALLGVWMALRVTDTMERQQAKLPSKTAGIERIIVESPVEEAQAAPAEEETPAEDINIHALPKAPIAGIFETTPAGQVPVANLQTGLTPFDAYKKPITPVPGRPMIGIIFLGAGLSESLTRGITEDLPPEISLAVSPYALAPGQWMDQIRDDGHEVWLTLPLQNDTYPEPDPGPNTILSSVSIEQNQDRLMKILASGAGYAGVISLDDHHFTAESTDIVPVLQQIFGRGLAFIDGRPDRPFFGMGLAKTQSYPYADSDMTIGEDTPLPAIKAQLTILEAAATRKGGAIAYVYPTPASIAAIAEWSKTLPDRGLQLAPASALIVQ